MSVVSNAAIVREAVEQVAEFRRDELVRLLDRLLSMSDSGAFTLSEGFLAR